MIYEEGQVSFYDVETSSHIYSFTGFTFTEKLCPFLNPETDIDGENSSPLVITPVSQIDEPDMKEKTWSEIEIRNIACIFFFFFYLITSVPFVYQSLNLASSSILLHVIHLRSLPYFLLSVC